MYKSTWKLKREAEEDYNKKALLLCIVDFAIIIGIYTPSLLGAVMN